MNSHREECLYQMEMVAANIRFDTAVALGATHVVYKPRLSIDGNQWCALYGENLQDGVVGFGDSPVEAMAAFDKAWIRKL